MSSLVLENGGSEDEALLPDAPEDQGAYHTGPKDPRRTPIAGELESIIGEFE
ncbi:MAG TPA: hypothetical protein VGN11_12210 [Candidatus Baltobacteraceae bacterium]|nr:hypothetical protein [Candidatus Baltobacteraceae bacterium]